MIAAPVRGAELERAIRAGYLATIVPERVATSPEEAVDRIAAAFGDRPTRSGRGTAGIAAVREWLFDATANGRAKDALLLVAPHTHWDEGLPIVYRADSPKRYLVGPSRVDPDRDYRPVSFVFTEGAARPYEWADDSIALPDAELAELYAVVSAASARFWRQNWPLGLSVNFRFKASLFDDRLIDHLEQEIVGDPDDQSEIVRDSSHGTPAASHANVLQVAWHCYSDRCHGLADGELALVEKLRALSDTMEGGAWTSAAASGRIAPKND